MYKAKYQIWLLVLGISFVFAMISSINFTTEYYTISSDLETDFKNRFDGFTKSNLGFKVVESSDSDFIISKSSEGKIDGYTKYPNQFYSEFIIYMQTGKYCGSGCNFYTDLTSNINTFENVIDLKNLLITFENDGTYKDLGLIELNNEHDKEKYLNLNNKIILYLPNKGMHYYNEAKTLVAYALNDYVYEGIDNPELQDRVDAIFEKAKKYSSDGELTTKIFNSANIESRAIFIAPTYIKDVCLIDSTPNGYYNYICFYPSKTISIKYDLYAKDVEKKNTYSEIFEILKTDWFYRNVGLKNNEIDFSKTLYGTTNYK